MNILFDIISVQSFMSGGGEYVKKVFKELELIDNVNIYCLYDSSLNINPKDLSFFVTSEDKLLDINKNDVHFYIQSFSIDTFFIGIAQRYLKYNLKGIVCKTFVIIHDIGDIEKFSNGFQYHFPFSLKSWVRNMIDSCPYLAKFSTITRTLFLYKEFNNFLAQDNVQIITVSNYTLNSIRYYFPMLDTKHIYVLYPPEKISSESDICQNVELENFFSKKLKYFLLVSADRDNKNAVLAYKVFNRLQTSSTNFHLVVTGTNKVKSSNISSFDFLSSSDLNLLYKNAQALIYPSLTEGFGYPPLEAMKFGIPVLSSNTCSMVEVLDNAVIYFSPFYQNDLYSKILYFRDHKDEYVLKAKEQYFKLSQKQADDFSFLINLITTV